MYGPSINSLNVYIQTASNLTKAWTRTGTQGNQWLYGEISIADYDKCQIIIEATRGNSYLGDIAVDDIGYSNTPCMPAKTSSLCDFEDITLCGFTQDKNDSFDWTWKAGETVTGFTGPSADHTQGTATGHYMYIESSTPQHPGDRARLVSPTYPPTIGSCLSFYYNMYGLTMGTLKVYLAGTGPAAPYQLLFQKSGNQGKNWLMAESEVESPTSFNIYFDGIVGSKYYSDLAIDDINLQTGSCQGDGQ
ncbi:MAM and LDL-receptor class A domain-containing protein 1-like [Pomacea canaliculata]|uniref:MAM and LDL-receptor class A domain-containing protein 1-like n=1 Tax=Pomacea canaliculata TaxID=400727 RepID=UPI000D73A9B6|nr:MAM and LDL-receptor class A domain-containing protein 1-like [Pomacea canaliculata]